MNGYLKSRNNWLNVDSSFCFVLVVLWWRTPRDVYLFNTKEKNKGWKVAPAEMQLASLVIDLEKSTNNFISYNLRYRVLPYTQVASANLDGQWFFRIFWKVCPYCLTTQTGNQSFLIEMSVNLFPLFTITWTWAQYQHRINFIITIILQATRQILKWFSKELFH